MTVKEVRKELKKIYKDIKTWPRINKRLKYKIPKEEVYRRGAVFSLQHILYEIEDAKRERDKNKEYFNLASYYLTKPDTILKS
jgi:hypothetical protein